MVGLTYIGADGKRHELETKDAKDAMARLSRIPGYVNDRADSITKTIADGLRMKRRQRADAFASKMLHGGNRGVADTGFNQSVVRQGIGTSMIIPGFGGLIVEDGFVVGSKVFDIKVEDGMVVGTSGMREERFQARKWADVEKSIQNHVDAAHETWVRSMTS